LFFQVPATRLNASGTALWSSLFASAGVIVMGSVLAIVWLHMADALQDATKQQSFFFAREDAGY